MTTTLYETRLSQFSELADVKDQAAKVLSVMGFKETALLVRLLGVKSLKLHISTVLYFISFMTHCNVLKN